MKKIVFLLMLTSFFVMPVFAQDPPKDEPTATQIVDRVFDRTTEAVKDLADALKVPAERVYEVLIKQQKVEGVILLVSFIICLLIGVLAGYLSFIVDAKYDRDGLSIALGALAIIVCVVGVIVLSTFLIEGLPHWINPEYGAIKDIMRTLNPS